MGKYQTRIRSIFLRPNLLPDMHNIRDIVGYLQLTTVGCIPGSLGRDPSIPPTWDFYVLRCGIPIWHCDRALRFGTSIGHSDLALGFGITIRHSDLGLRFGTPVWHSDLAFRLGIPTWHSELALRFWRTPI